jgi:TPR repeat protein
MANIETLRVQAADGNVEALAEIGFQAYVVGDYETAAAYWEKGARAGGDRCVCGLGFLAADAGDFEKAREILERAAGLGNPAAFVYLGDLAAVANDEEQQTYWYEKAAALEHPRAEFHLGLRAEEADNGDGARKWFERAAAGGDGESMHRIGLMEEMAEELANARTWFERAADAGYPDAVTRVGLLVHEDGDFAAARVFLERGADLWEPRALLSLVLIDALSGDLESSRSWLSKAGETIYPEPTFRIDAVDINDTELEQRLLESLAQLDGPGPGAAAELRELIAGAKGDPAQLNYVAMIALKAGCTDIAGEMLRRATEVGSLEAILGIAAAAVDAHEKGLALRAVEASAALGSVDAEQLHLQVLLHAEDFIGAVPVLIDRFEGGDCDAAFELARVARSVGSKRLAREWTVRAAAMGQGKAALQLARFAESEGDTDGYNAWLDRGVELDDPDALFERALDLRDIGDRKAARPILLRLMNEFGNALAGREAGVFDREAGREDSAMDLFHRAAELGDSTAMYDIGIFHEHRGENDEALRWYRRGADAGDARLVQAVANLEAAMNIVVEIDSDLLAAAERGDSEAMLRIGRAYLQAGDFGNAYRFAERAAEAGDVRGVTFQADLAAHRFPNEPHRTEELFQKAAAAGDPEAMFGLGKVAYQSGSRADAVDWWIKAADAGSEAAALHLGQYEQGWLEADVVLGERDRDFGAALRWYERAIELGSRSAYGFMAECAVELDDEGERDRIIERGLRISEELFVLENVDDIARDRPEDMRIAPQDERESVPIGKSVKLLWIDGHGAERMWTEVLRVRDGRYVGYLDSNPVHMQIHRGTLVEFGPEHIIEISNPTDADMEGMLEKFAAGEDLFTVENVPAGVSGDVWREVSAQARAGDAEASERCARYWLATSAPERAAEWLDLGISQGSIWCHSVLAGFRFHDGDLVGAAELWRFGTDHGDADAMVSLATLRFTQFGANDQDGQDWLTRAADLGNALAMYMLGGIARDAGDLEVARSWWESAAERGETNAMNGLGILCVEAGHPDRATTWWEAAANEGNTISMHCLADLARANGDEQTARLWFRRGAEAGDALAMFYVGVFAQEDGDLEGAREWWERSAALGSDEATFNLGVDAINAGDFATARHWFRQVLGSDDEEMKTAATDALQILDSAEAGSDPS